jgi:hypothetical protein
MEADLGIPDVHLMNISRGRATISNEEGYFGLEVREGDTLLISAVRYQRKNLVISREMIESVLFTIPLDPYVNELDEIVVTPYDLSGDLVRDLQMLPKDQEVSAISLGLPNARAKDWTPTENRLNEATTGGGIVPLNPILNAISGRTKRLKTQLALERRYDKVRAIRKQYSDSVITEELGIPRIRIPDFMYYCEVDSLFETIADSGDQLQLWGFLRRKSNEYRRNNTLD